jgi:hypothetical protein
VPEKHALQKTNLFFDGETEEFWTNVVAGFQRATGGDFLEGGKMHTFLTPHSGFQVHWSVLNRYENSLLYMILQPVTSNSICSVLIPSARL